MLSTKRCAREDVGAYTYDVSVETLRVFHKDTMQMFLSFS